MNLLRSVSSLYRTPSANNLVRVGVVQTPSLDQFDTLLTSLISSCLHASTSADVEVPPQSHIYRKALYSFTDWHVKQHADSAVPIPNWSRLSQEQTELDVFPVSSSTAHDRTNAVLLLHDTRSGCANEVSDLLSSLPKHLPVTLAGVVPDRDVSLGDFGMNQQNYHKWMANHAELSYEHPSVYGSTFVSPGLFGQGFHTLYTAQSSVLYPKSRLTGERFEHVCATIAPNWNPSTVARFGAVAYGRELREEEQEQLISALDLRQLLGGLAAAGKSDVVWAWLRAHGYDGRLNRK